MRLKMRGTLMRIVGFTSARFSTIFSTASQSAIDAPIESIVFSSTV